MKKLCLIIIFLIVFFTSYAQQTTLIIHKIIGHKYLLYNTPITPDDSIVFKIPAYIKYKIYSNYHFYNYPLEETFRRYKSGQFTYAKFIAFEKSYAPNTFIDTLILSGNIKNYPSSVKTHMMSGLDSNDNKIVLIDINRDGKITPDEVFKFNPEEIKNIKAHSDTLKYFKNITLGQRGKDGSYRSVNVKIIPGPYYSRYADEKQKLTDFGFLRDEYWYGSCNINKDTLNIFADSKQFSNEIASLDFKAGINGVIDKNTLELKDEWANSKYSLTVDSVVKLDDDKMKLFISYQSPPKKHTDTTFKMIITNVNTGKQESLTQYLHQKKYILIDYWGTWCGPCIEKIPALKDLNMKYGSKFSLIGVAYDYEINKVKKFDDENYINWSSYFIDRKISQNLTKPLKVSNYPTFRLYNDTGTLIMEGNTNEDLDKIEQKISQL